MNLGNYCTRKATFLLETTEFCHQETKRKKRLQDVRRNETRGMCEYVGQSVLEQSIWSGIHHKRFHIAAHTPVCKGKTRETFGYLGTTLSARQVLAGAYTYPLDFDQATKELCKSCTRFCLGIPSNSSDTNIRHRVWSDKWSKAKEKTLSSESGLHFGHYKAAV